ncbi:MAG: hypothetical protein WCP62_12010, partial [Planctomycetota bacterium]
MLNGFSGTGIAPAKRIFLPGLFLGSSVDPFPNGVEETMAIADAEKTVHAPKIRHTECFIDGKWRPSLS